MTSERLAQLREHVRRGNHCTSQMAEELLAEIDRLANYKRLSEEAWRALWDARAYLKNTDESPGAVEHITDSIERLTALHSEARP